MKKIGPYKIKTPPASDHSFRVSHEWPMETIGLYKIKTCDNYRALRSRQLRIGR